MARGLVSGLAIIIALTPTSAWADPVTIVAAAIAATSYTAATATAAAVWGFSWATFGLSLALGAASKLLQKKPKQSTSGSTAIKSGGYNQQIRQPISAREIVYGNMRKSGAIIYAGVSSGNEKLHMMIALASHQVEKIGEIIVDDESITDDMLDANGNVTSGRYSGVMRIRKHLGETTQTADSFAVSEIPEWTTEHRGRGVAYVYLTMTWNVNKYPNGIPNFSFWVDGKRILDVRDSSTKWTANPSLFVYDYLIETPLGAGVRSEYVDTTDFSTAANICEEFVTTSNLDMNILSVDATKDLLTLQGETLLFLVGDRVKLQSGTIGGLSGATDYYVIPYQRQKTPRIKLAASYEDALAGTAINLTSGTTGVLRKIAEPRYQAGGVVLGQQSPSDNIEEILTSYAGTLTYAGGKFRTLAGGYRTPTIYLDESDLVGAITVQTKVSKQNRFNRIQGVYTGQINDGNPADYPIVKNDTYATEDGEFLASSYDLPWTQRPHTAQRLAKIQLEDFRQEIRFTAPFKLTAFKLQVGDNFFFSFARHGWVNKVFEVKSWKISVTDGAPVIEMAVKETASTIWDWDSGMETAVDPAPNSSFPNVFDVAPVTSLAANPQEISTATGDKTYKFTLSWAEPNDFYVKNGGKYEVQFKKTVDDPEFRPSFFVEGGTNFSDIYQVEPDITYDARVRAVNFYGVKSEWTSLLAFTVSSPSGVSFRLDYGFVSESVTTSLDYGLVSDSVGTSLDYGSVV